MNNREKLQQLIIDVLLLDATEFNFNLRRDEVDTWDSLAIVSIGVGVHETFGYHPTPEEATALRSVNDIINLLQSKGVEFDQEA